MKLLITPLLALLGAASAQVQTVEDRVELGMAIWGTTMAHCRENSGDGWEVDKEKFKACKKCFSGVGDWLTTDGLERGMACLEEFEPDTIKSCGEMLNDLPEKNFDPAEAGSSFCRASHPWREARGARRPNETQQTSASA